MKKWIITLCLMLGLLLSAAPAMAAQETKGLTLTTEVPAAEQTDSTVEAGDAGANSDNAATGVDNHTGALAAAGVMLAAAGSLGVYRLKRRQ